ncbi:MAG: hypothetical protein IJ461_09260 [Clostridia bacterium]|nr:hypothetical protein [Clostridia bacterium]
MWEILIPIALCFLAGIGLIVLEVFLPGFGLPGIGGIALLLGSSVLTWVNVNGVAALGVTIICLAVAAIAISLAMKSASKGRLANSKIVLMDTESAEAGYNSISDMEVFLGREGMTTTVLRPTGIADFDGVRLNVMTEGEFLNANTRVRIDKVEGARIVVKAI